MTLPKAILFDLDDTLVISKQPVTDKMASQLSKLLDKTVVCIVSGSEGGLINRQVIANLPKESNFSNLYLFPTGAAQCFSYKSIEPKIEYSHLFTDDEANKVISVLQNILDETKIVEGEKIYGEIIENRGGQISLSALGQQAPVEAKRPWDQDKKKRIILRQQLLPLLPDCEINIGGMTTLDITKKGIDKRLSIYWIKDKLGCELNDLLYIGDALFEGGNDAIIKETGAPTLQTSDPDETYEIIGRFL
jgi:phosphomannomutase